jgi:pimeloyl-ACP methyl ester carboxylesterase
LSKTWRIVLIVVVVLLVVVLVGPFLVPIPPLPDTVSPDQLGDPDSLFLDVNGLRVHYKTIGQAEPTLVLLHGFGASLFSWHEVMAPLAKVGRVIAYDRPAFGLTSRPMPGEGSEWSGQNPYSPDAQVELLAALLDKLGVEKAVLVGNSAGGTVAVAMALRYPERVSALVLVDPAIYGSGGAPGWVRPFLALPQVRRLGPLLVRSIQERGDTLIRSAWYDPSRIGPDVLAGYRKVLRAKDWDRALFEFTAASRPLNLEKQLGRLTMPTLVITGDHDTWVPTAQSVRLAGELPNARLVVIPECGHLPQEERPELFMQAVTGFLAGQ